MDPIQSMLAVLLVLGLLASTLAVLRKRSMLTWRLPGMAATPSTRRMELVERIALGPNHALHLVRIDERSVLVATTPGSCQILDAHSREDGRSRS